MNLYESVKSKLTEADSADTEYFHQQVNKATDDLVTLAREAEQSQLPSLKQSLSNIASRLESIPDAFFLSDEERGFNDSENLAEGNAHQNANARTERAEANGGKAGTVYSTEDYALWWYQSKDGYSRFEVIPSDGIYKEHSITVEIDDNYTENGIATKITKAKVNWPAIGSTNSDEAVAFANALKTAADFADKINGQDFSKTLKQWGFID